MFFDQMPPSRTSDERALRSERAKSILADPIFVEAMEETERACIEQAVHGKDPEVRERARMMIGCLYGIRQHILAVVDERPLTTAEG